jgi:hypothetical protein
MDVSGAVEQAERLLPGEGPIAAEADPRWKALLELRMHVSAEPEAVWQFVKRWASSEEETLRHALAVCLLQELLALHFVAYFPLIEARVREEHRFADTLRRCGRYGQTALPAQSKAFDGLVRFAEAWSGADLSETRFRVRGSADVNL